MSIEANKNYTRYVPDGFDINSDNKKINKNEVIHRIFNDSIRNNSNALLWATFIPGVFCPLFAPIGLAIALLVLYVSSCSKAKVALQNKRLDLLQQGDFKTLFNYIKLNKDIKLDKKNDESLLKTRAHEYYKSACQIKDETAKDKFKLYKKLLIEAKNRV